MGDGEGGTKTMELQFTCPLIKLWKMSVTPAETERKNIIFNYIFFNFST